MPAIPERWKKAALSLDHYCTSSALNKITDRINAINGTSGGPAPGGIPARVESFNYLVARGFLVRNQKGRNKGKIDVANPPITWEANQYLVERLEDILPDDFGKDEMQFLHVDEVMRIRQGATEMLLKAGIFVFNKDQLMDIKPGLFVVPQNFEPAGSETGPVQT